MVSLPFSARPGATSKGFALGYPAVISSPLGRISLKNRTFHAFRYERQRLGPDPQPDQKTKVNPHSFSTWFRPTSSVGDSVDSITVRVPNQLFRTG